MKIILDKKELDSVSVDSPDAIEFVRKISSRTLNDLDLHNFMKLFSAARNEYVVGSDSLIHADVIEIAALAYKHRFNWTFKLLNRANKGTRARSAEIAAMARSTYYFHLLDDVKNLSKKMKTHYFSMISDYVNIQDFILYAKVMSSSGLTITKMAGSEHEDSIKFVKALNTEIKNTDRTKEFDTSEPSSEFLGMIETRIPPYGKHYDYRIAYITALFVLRAMYGETTLLEIFDQHDEGLESPETFLHVVQNWESLKGYPLNWLLDLLSK